ncbi:MAG TPA: hypothetical protein VNI84_08355, partial [Pyrinomonadaceae bacterium]|nr:hypothetical protein [Pyrinomonadaceae bacterium]
MKKFSFLLIILLFGNVFGQYQKPSKDVMDVLNAPVTPSSSVSPAKDKMLLAEPLRYPPISELAQPMLRLAGLRINPNTNGQHRQPYFVKLTLKNIADGKEMPVNLPQGAQVISPNWSADGRYIAFGNQTPSGIELWILDTSSGKAKMLKNVKVNTAFGRFDWMPDQKSLLVNLVPQKRGTAPVYQNLTPTAPSIQETAGKKGAVQTFQDLLKSPNDELLFEYYATSQLAIVDLNGKVKEIGQPAIFETADVSPDGQYVLVSRVQRPYSYLFPASRFPSEVEIWNTSGKMIHKLDSSPLQDNLPVQGVPTGPRGHGWNPNETATIVWVEALDGGDPRKKITPRDKIVKLAAPFSGEPTEVVKVEQRYQGRAFGERDGLMLFFDYNRDTQRRRIFSMNFNNPSEKPKLISDLNTGDRYNDIGAPVFKTLPNGQNVIQQNGDEIFLTGAGASREGDRPFLRRMNLKTLKTNEIWRSGNTEFEGFVTLMDANALKFLTRKESPLDPANLYLRKVCDPDKKCPPFEPQRLTNFIDPTPQLRGITKRLVQ